MKAVFKQTVVARKGASDKRLKDIIKEVFETVELELRSNADYEKDIKEIARMYNLSEEETEKLIKLIPPLQ